MYKGHMFIKEDVEDIRDYYASHRMSNSLLKLIKYPRAFKAKIDGEEVPSEETKSLRIGSALDCILTSPARWKEDFVVVEHERPYGSLGIFTSCLPCGLAPSSPNEEYIKAYEEAAYKIGLPAVIRRFWNSDDAVSFYREVMCKDHGTKTIISKSEYEAVDKCLKSILANKYAKDFFISSSLDIELLHQVSIFFDYKEVPFKALLDGIVVDHAAKTIRPFDLKTTGNSVFNFKHSFMSFGYFRQAALYSYAIQQETSPVFKLLQEGYTLLPFQFIVVETRLTADNPPLIYETSAYDIQCGFTGGMVDSEYYEGIDELLDDYKWHLEKDYWDLPRRVFESNGIVPLNVFTD